MVCSAPTGSGAVRLTKRVIDQTTYHGRVGTAHYLWDDQIAGFGVRLYPSGRKSFFLAYRAKGRQRFLTLGRFGELTLQEARVRWHVRAEEPLPCLCALAGALPPRGWHQGGRGLGRSDRPAPYTAVHSRI